MTGTPDWRAWLNKAQLQAAGHDSGPLVVLAGPGTGKTRVIIARILRLLEEGTPPESILAVTFTRKSTDEMRSRLAEALADAPDPRAADRVQVSTLHGLGSRIVIRFGDMIGLRSERTLMDAAQQKRMLRALVREHGLFKIDEAKGRDGALADAIKSIEQCKNAARTPADARAFATERRSKIERNDDGLAGDELQAERYNAAVFAEHARLFELYEQVCTAKGLVTFEDFLSLPLRIFEERPVAGALLRTEIKHVVVDEFQDLNTAQIELLRHLIPPRTDSGRPADICVVGDDDQAIYGFRGSDPRAFTRFSAIWTGHETIPLTENYRSTPEIIRAANKVISRVGSRFAPDKEIIAAKKGVNASVTGKLEGIILQNDGEAGNVVAAMILGEMKDNPARRWSDYAVIARTRTTRDRIAAELELQDIPIDIRISPSPLDDEAVRDLQSWIGLLLGNGADEHAHRLLVRPLCAIDPRIALEWKKQWQEARGRSGGRAAFPGFADWVSVSCTDHPGVKLFAGILASLRLAAATDPADRVIERIIRETRAAAADGFATDNLNPRERALRVQRLVQVIQFARSRQQYLDPPGKLADFQRYYEDLDDKGKRFESPSMDGLDNDPDGADENGRTNAVRIMTCHSAKGLEFDTVFVAQVRPGHGFPYTQKRGDDLDLPDEFLDRAADAPTDEERRLFYVACTRAKRRLVLLAKDKKSELKGKTLDYFKELTIDNGPELGFVRTKSDTWLNRPELPVPASERTAPELETTQAAGGAAAILDRELHRARVLGLELLRGAERTGADPAARSELHRRLSESADLIAALSSLRTGGTLPDFATPGSPLQQRLAPLLERLAEQPHNGLFTPPRAPLSLNFTSLNQYIECPRCWYLKYQLGLHEPQTDNLNVGNIAHKTLKAFYDERTMAENDGREPPGLSRLLALAEEFYRADWPASRDFDEEPLQQIRAQLRLMMEKLHDDKAERIESLERPVKFEYAAAGISHQMIAKIDRVDRLRDQSLRVIDYKTGGASQKYLKPSKTDLQLGIYLLALPHMLEEESVSGVAEYWCLADGVKGAIALEDLNLVKVREKINKAVAGILGGSFERGKRCRGSCGLLGGDSSAVDPDESDDE